MMNSCSKINFHQQIKKHYRTISLLPNTACYGGEWRMCDFWKYNSQ